MADVTDYIVVLQPTLAGAQASYELPENCKGITIKASGGAITFSDASGGVEYPIADGEALVLDNRNLQGKTIYINGAAGTCYIIAELGLAC